MTDILPEIGATDKDPSSGQDRPVLTPHTQIHTLVRRVLENMQDVIVLLLMVLLLALSLQALWRLALKAFFEGATTTQLLSEIVFVLILTELFRLLIFYLREHRISVALAVEVAIVSTLREIMLKVYTRLNGLLCWGLACYCSC